MSGVGQGYVTGMRRGTEEEGGVWKRRVTARILTLGDWRVLVCALKMRTTEEMARRLKVKFIEPQATKRCSGEPPSVFPETPECVSLSSQQLVSEDVSVFLPFVAVVPGTVLTSCDYESCSLS